MVWVLCCNRLPFPCHSTLFSVDSISTQYIFLRLFFVAVSLSGATFCSNTKLCSIDFFLVTFCLAKFCL